MRGGRIVMQLHGGAHVIIADAGLDVASVRVALVPLLEDGVEEVGLVQLRTAG